jgi:GxxExxY protein
MIVNEPIEDELTYKVIGCAMAVHKTLGNGFQEVIYQRCLAIELQQALIGFRREVEQPLYYRSQHVGTRRADFIIEDKIIVELKAVIKLEDVHLSQAKNYLTAYNFDIGLLINFGSASMEYKRIFKGIKSGKSSNPAHADPKSGKSSNPGHPDHADN